MDIPSTGGQSSNLGTVLEIAKWVIILVAIKKVGEALGFFETRDDRRAEKFRNEPYLYPMYYKEELGVDNFYDAAKLIYTPADLPKMESALKNVFAFWGQKGYISDNEDKAVTILKSTIHSKVDFSMFADVFENSSKFKEMTGSGITGVDYGDFLTYMDSFLENSVQTKLWEWSKKLPILTERQKINYRNNTGIDFDTKKRVTTDKKGATKKVSGKKTDKAAADAIKKQFSKVVVAAAKEKNRA